MSLRLPIIVRKTVGDLSDPKWLGAYLVGYVSVAWFLGVGFGNNEFADNVAELTLAQQELQLLGSYATISWFWGVGIPILVVGAVFGANTLAREAETGTLRMLLSKPVRRWEVLLGTFLGIVVSLLSVGIASMLVSAVMLYYYSGTAAAAIGGGVFAALAENVAFLLVVAVFIAAVGVALAVATQSRLQTVLGGLSVSVSFFVLWLVRLINRSFYEEYSLYLVDASYHLGNVYVLVHEALGGGLPTEAKLIFGGFSGVYDLEGVDGNGPPESIELVGHVDPTVSLAAIAVLTVAFLAVAAYRFQRLDV